MIGVIIAGKGAEYGLIYNTRHFLSHAIGVEGDANVNSILESSVSANGTQLQISDFHQPNFLFYLVLRTLMPKDFGI